MLSERLTSSKDFLKSNLVSGWDFLSSSAGDYPNLGIAQRFGGAAAAYSLRDIGVNNGPVVDVRCSNGTAPFSALQVSGGAIEAFVGSGNDGFVSKWYDQSGNGRHMSQSNTADQPRIVNSGTLETDPGGNPTVKFLNVGTNLGSTFLERSIIAAGETALAYLTVSSISTTVPTRQTFNGASTDLCLNSNSMVRLRYNGSSDQHTSTLALSANTNHLIVASVNSSKVSTLHLDTSSQTNSSAFTGDALSLNQFLGENSDSADGDNLGLQGTMSEMILYLGDKTDNITDIKNDMNNYYNVY